MVQEKADLLSWAIQRGIPGISKHALMACEAENTDKSYENKI
jgi:hypothetical protein